MQQVVGTGEWLENGDESLDLRRKRQSTLSSRLVRRAHWLDPDDRELILAMFDRGLNAARIASMIGQNPRIVRKRIRQLVSRLNDPRVAYVVAHRPGWGRTRSRVARELFIRGRSMRETSDALGLSLHCVRKHRDAIEAMTLADQPGARVSRVWLNTEREPS